jgi:hypothetical protein
MMEPQQASDVTQLYVDNINQISNFSPSSFVFCHIGKQASQPRASQYGQASPPIAWHSGDYPNNVSIHSGSLHSFLVPYCKKIMIKGEREEKNKHTCVLSNIHVFSHMHTYLYTIKTEGTVGNGCILEGRRLMRR